MALRGFLAGRTSPPVVLASLLLEVGFGELSIFHDKCLKKISHLFERKKYILPCPNRSMVSEGTVNAQSFKLLSLGDFSSSRCLELMFNMGKKGWRGLAVLWVSLWVSLPRIWLCRPRGQRGPRGTTREGLCAESPGPSCLPGVHLPEHGHLTGARPTGHAPWHHPCRFRVIPVLSLLCPHYKPQGASHAWLPRAASTSHVPPWRLTCRRPEEIRAPGGFPTLQVPSTAARGGPSAPADSPVSPVGTRRLWEGGSGRSQFARRHTRTGSFSPAV